jgi:hypothetical protein
MPSRLGTQATTGSWVSSPAFSLPVRFPLQAGGPVELPPGAEFFRGFGRRKVIVHCGRNAAPRHLLTPFAAATSNAKAVTPCI